MEGESLICPLARCLSTAALPFICSRFLPACLFFANFRLPFPSLPTRSFRLSSLAARATRPLYLDSGITKTSLPVDRMKFSSSTLSIMCWILFRALRQKLPPTVQLILPQLLLLNSLRLPRRHLLLPVPPPVALPSRSNHSLLGWFSSMEQLALPWKMVCCKSM
jgi:hypothetical protein